MLRTIRDLMPQLPQEFNPHNYAAVEYVDGKGDSRAQYRITRDGFLLLLAEFG